jgi:hypothetical protein
LAAIAACRVGESRKALRAARGSGMRLSWRAAILAAATLGCFGTDFAKAGDDGAAPLWVGIGSIFGPLLGFSKEEKPPVDYREHGKLVLPPNADLPQPGASANSATDWPVNQEVVRKKLAKEEAKEKQIAGQGDARLRYTHPFPNAPVTVQASDQVDQQVPAGGKVVRAREPQPNELGWNGQERSAWPRTGPRVANRSPAGLPSPGWAGRTIGKLRIAERSAEGRYLIFRLGGGAETRYLEAQIRWNSVWSTAHGE